MRNFIDIASQVTLGDNMQNKNDGLSGSPPRGYKPNPSASEEHVETVYREMAKRLSSADWEAIRQACPGIPEDVLLPRHTNED